MPDVDYTVIFANLNYTASALAGLAGFVFGAVWYGALSGPWTAAADMPGGPSGAPPAGRPPLRLMALALAANILMAAVLSGIMLHIGAFSPGAGIFSAVLVWLGFAAPVIAVNYGFQRRRPVLFLIDGGHWLGALCVQGAVLGAAGAWAL